MKKSCFIYLLLVLLVCSCEKEEVLNPIADFAISKITLSVNETVTFEYTGSISKQVVIYTGDEGHDYELKNQSNTGLVVNKGILTYSYKKPGRYKVVLVATNYDKEGKEIIFDTAEKEVVVEDDRTDLRQISLKRDLYNKELLGQITENMILFTVPYKIRISGRDIAADISKQRLEISALSNTAEIMVDGAAYNSSTKYDLTKPVVLEVKSASGDSKQYTIETVRYAVFEDFNINGVAGVVQYSDFNFEKTLIKVTLPVGTNVTNLTPIFSSLDTESIKIADVEQTSGQSTVNFSNPVTYTLKNWKDGHEDNIYAESKIEVSVVLE